MPNRSRLVSTLVTLAVASPLAAQPAEKPVPMHEWTVPWKNTRPRDPIAAANGLVWFVGQVLVPQPVHVRAGALFPRLAVQQSQCTTDHVAGLLILAAVGLDDTKIFFCGAESNAHTPSVQQLLYN